MTNKLPRRPHLAPPNECGFWTFDWYAPNPAIPCVDCGSYELRIAWIREEESVWMEGGKNILIMLECLNCHRGLPLGIQDHEGRPGGREVGDKEGEHRFVRIIND